MFNAFKRFFGIHIHEWSKYENPTPFTQPAFYDIIDDAWLPAHKGMEQKRTCNTCGYIQYRQLG